MTRDTRTAYERFLPWRRPFEIGVCVANAVVGASFNSITMVMDAHRDGLNLADWEPAVWEWSSALAWLALVWPVAWFSRRFPFHWDTWTRQWPWHLLASVVVSGVHVLAMVGMRTLAYRWQGGHYDFGYWPVEWGYEYLKDVRTYALMVLVIESTGCCCGVCRARRWCSGARTTGRRWSRWSGRPASWSASWGASS